jgi:hypothetical protein
MHQEIFNQHKGIDLGRINRKFTKYNLKILLYFMQVELRYARVQRLT